MTQKFQIGQNYHPPNLDLLEDLLLFLDLLPAAAKELLTSRVHKDSALLPSIWYQTAQAQAIIIDLRITPSSVRSRL